VDPRTSAARAEALAAREALASELQALEASARAAADLPARVRRNPVRTVGAAAGAGFLLLGGPGRVARGIRRALGRPEPLPKSMLPREVEKTLRSMGDDGERVRGTLEREFARYLDEHAEARRDRDLGAVAALALANLVKPATRAAGLKLAKDLVAPDGPGFGQQLARLRERMAAAAEKTGSREVAGSASSDQRAADKSGEPI